MTLASKIDHTILKAEATFADVDRIVAEGKQYGFASVCVNGAFVARVAKELAGSGVKTCAVAGFPLGAMKPTVKAIEATSTVKDGAAEVDFVADLVIRKVHHLRAMSPLYEMHKDGIDLKSVAWVAH